MTELGLGSRGVQLRAAAGRLHRVHHGVYSLVPVSLLKREGYWMAAVLACAPGPAAAPAAALSHRSAAALLELRQHGAARIDVTVPRRSALRRDGVCAHRSSTLEPSDVEIVNGIPCTSVARTLLDLAAVVNSRQLERACDQAEILGVFDLRAVEDQLVRNPNHKGVRVMKAIIHDHAIGQTPTWSELEERLLALVRKAGLPTPAVNELIDPHDGDPAIRVDFVWRRQKIALETDGHATHRTRRAFELDRRRDQRLTLAGWRPVRTTWRQLTKAPGEVEGMLRALLGA